jgi:hypothetical protein
MFSAAAENILSFSLPFLNEGAVFVKIYVILRVFR